MRAPVGAIVAITNLFATKVADLGEFVEETKIICGKRDGGRAG
jgi:hypothetical protein